MLSAFLDKIIVANESVQTISVRFQKKMFFIKVNCEYKLSNLNFAKFTK